MAITGSPNTSPHFDNDLFVVIMVELFSYLLDIIWNNNLLDNSSNGKNPTSSIINNLYLAKNFSLCSNLFSIWALFNCNTKSLHDIKYVDTLFFASSIPIDVAKFYFPTPGDPTNNMFSHLFIKSKYL